MLITKLDVTKLEKAINSFENAIKAPEDIEKILKSI
jgi:exonuclease VII small subunit